MDLEPKHRINRSYDYEDPFDGPNHQVRYVNCLLEI